MKHDGIKFKCRKCDSSYFWQSNLSRHVKTKHKYYVNIFVEHNTVFFKYQTEHYLTVYPSQM